ncbi:myosuppressin [Adelges cooleyi]|uniref:myosuppressin n=1 Tax=Adelges cooleyi TaxID=133065 RepID=UPI00217F3541|nr:myosuppressin [Adelges cooleyi]
MSTLYNVTVVMAAFLLLVVGNCECRINNLPTQCLPGLLEDAPPKVREACFTLSTIRTLSNAIETYIQDKQYPVSMPYARMADGLTDTAMQNDKRQDLDHVFLRFGRRRR